MRIDRFFNHKLIDENENHIKCENQLFHYIITVLRKKIGAKIVLFDNSGFDYLCEIVYISKKYCGLVVKKRTLNDKESLLNLTLGQSVSNLNKFDFVLQKSVELGVNDIYPIFSQFSDFKFNLFEKQQDHFQKIIISACEQSNRAKIPNLHSLISFQDFIINMQSELNIILHPYGNSFDFSSSNKIKSLSFLIGPAGGFSKEEVLFASQNNFYVKTFGSRILRTETAAIVALTYAQLNFGDF